MKKTILALALAATALFVGGCLPEEFIWWSPDGRTAAIRTPDGLALAGTNGQLSAIVLPGNIQSAAWMPDGSSLVVSRSRTLTNWAAVEPLISREEAAVTLQLAQAIPALLKAGLTASAGSLDELAEKFLKPLGLTESEAWQPPLFCAITLHRQELVAAVAGFTNAAALEAELSTATTNGITVYEIAILPLRNGQPAGPPRTLVSSLRPLLDPILSPSHAILAFRAGEGALKAMTLDGKRSLVVADEAVRSAAWSPDGRTLLHVAMEKSDKVGEIRSCTVVEERGELASSAPQAQTLAMAVFAASGPPRLAVLPDGRLLFASLPITLPAPAAAINPGAQFFLLDPARPELAPVAVAIKEGSLPDDLSAFAPSPDGEFVAVVEGGTDAVALLELATGKVKIISPAHAGWKSRLIPAWKTPHELTFAVPSATGAAHPELVLWQAAEPGRVLSKDWPENIVKPWLEAPGSGEDKPAK